MFICFDVKQSTEGECDYSRRLPMIDEAGAKFRRSRPISVRSVPTQVDKSKYINTLVYQITSIRHTNLYVRVYSWFLFLTSEDFFFTFFNSSNS